MRSWGESEPDTGAKFQVQHFLIITCMDARRHPRFFYRLPYDDKGNIRSIPKSIEEFLERNKERWPITEFMVI